MAIKQHMILQQVSLQQELLLVLLVKSRLTRTAIIRYGYIPNDGSETYANKAKLYADNDEHITWSQWYDGTTLKDNTLPMADLVTGDNAVTLIKVQVGMRQQTM